VKKSLTLLVLLLVIGCAVSPLGRKQLKLLPDSQMNEMGIVAFQDMVANVPQSDDPAVLAYVQCIADAIADQAADETGVTHWELRVFDDETPNAFALPGGKIGVHTGLLNVAVTANQLAAVIGHEVGHVIARHGNERVSTAMAAQAGLGVAELLARDKSPKDREQLLGLLGLGAQLGVLLPYSRVQEKEADLVGLDLMAAAGFDPRESVDLWYNMMAAGGGAPPEFMSTHPSGETRIRDLEERMVGAMALYEAARAAGQRPDCGPPPRVGGNAP
jgi:predicted Zn-dependent protease